MFVNVRERHEIVKLQRAENVKVDSFKSPETTIQRRRGEDETAVRGGLRDIRESCCDVWFAESSTDKKTVDCHRACPTWTR